MNEFKRGWKPLVACILGTGCGIIAVTFYTQGLFLDPVKDTFDWDRGQFYNGFTILMVAGLLTAPVVGMLVDRKGARLVGIIGLVGHAIGYLLLSINNGSLTLWYVSFFLLAVFAAGSLPVTWTTIVNSWFDKQRGLAIGLMMGGSGLMAIVAPPLVEWLISNYGWRVAYRSLGIGALCVSLPIVFMWLKNKDMHPGNAAGATREVTDWGYTRAEALRSARFWMLGSGLALLVLSLGGLVPNFIPILTDNGFSRFEASGIASSMGLAIIVGRICTGYLVDKFWAPGVAACILTLPTVSIVFLAFSPSVVLVAVATSITLGLATGAILDLLAYLTSRYFGIRHFGAVFGAIFVFFTVSAGLAPNIYGRAYEYAGSYFPILLTSTGMLITAMCLFLSLGKYPQPHTIESTTSSS